MSIVAASKLDNILTIHCSKPYKTAFHTVTILSIPVFDEPNTSYSGQLPSGYETMSLKSYAETWTYVSVSMSIAGNSKQIFTRRSVQFAD